MRLGHKAALGGLGLAALALLVGSTAEASTPVPGPPSPKPGPPPPGPGPAGLPSFELGGHAWCRALPNRENVPARERAFLEAVRGGYLRPIVWSPVDCSRGEHTGTIWVSEDAIAVGTEADFVRVCLSALGSQRIADELGAVLQTSRTSDLSYAQAAVKLMPQDMGPGSSAELEAMIAHSDAVERARAGRSGLVRDVGKDVILSPRLLNDQGAYRGRLGNFSWYADSAPNRSPAGAHVWQMVATAHSDKFVDDSMTLCVVRGDMIADGASWPTAEVYAHPTLSQLVSDEGPLPIVRYPA